MQENVLYPLIQLNLIYKDNQAERQENNNNSKQQ